MSVETLDQQRRSILALKKYGLIYNPSSKNTSIAVIDQLCGPRHVCGWLRYLRHPEGYSLAWRLGSEPGKVAVPEGWAYEKSLTRKYNDHGPVPSRNRWRYLRTKGGVDVFLDRRKGKEVQIERLFREQRRPRKNSDSVRKEDSRSRIDMKLIVGKAHVEGSQTTTCFFCGSEFEFHAGSLICAVEVSDDRISSAAGKHACQRCAGQTDKELASGLESRSGQLRKRASNLRKKAKTLEDLAERLGRIKGQKIQREWRPSLYE